MSNKRVAGLLGALAGAAILAIFWAAAAGMRPALPISKREVGQQIRGVRHVRVIDGKETLRVSAEAATLRRPRLGVFRIGIARELWVRNAAVEVDLTGRDSVGDLSRLDLRRVADAFAPEARSGRGAIVSVRIDGLRLALRDGKGRRLELEARECSSGLRERGRIHCAGDVRFRDDVDELRFAELDFDPALGRFSEASSTENEQVLPSDRLDAANQLLRAFASRARIVLGSGLGNGMEERS